MITAIENYAFSLAHNKGQTAESSSVCLFMSPGKRLSSDYREKPLIKVEIYYTSFLAPVAPKTGCQPTCKQKPRIRKTVGARPGNKDTRVTRASPPLAHSTMTVTDQGGRRWPPSSTKPLLKRPRRTGRTQGPRRPRGTSGPDPNFFVLYGVYMKCFYPC